MLQPPFKWTCKKREDQPGVSVTMSEFLTRPHIPTQIEEMPSSDTTTALVHVKK
ncbi:unnamed protein product [Acanthoscelides obtectus]|uniref:Uncharacterized protein n=1 Tax=Acanthoscelides obtectus TaxID=200917 RepID=A0A9P0PMR0_ACAOB|nr:unnamed protein product [Acanthoscelides obtectus]CAK1681087.1 hypothetical protein AOBTE_LOCUS33011 [Acanthoscelides obtectus]